MININEVTMIAGSKRVFNFSKTAKLTYFHIKPGDMSIRTEGTDNWPGINIGTVDKPAYQGGTLYVFRFIENKWYCAPAERLRRTGPDQLNGSKSVATEGMQTLIGNGWFGKSEFGILSKNNPAIGEPVGFMIVAGSTRLDDRTPLEARTPIIVCAYGSEEPMKILWSEGDSVPVPTNPTPIPNNPTPTNQVLVEKESLELILRALNSAIENQIVLMNDINELKNQVEETTFAGSIRVFGQTIGIELKPVETKSKV